MAGENITPDAAWVMGSVATALIATGPAYITARSQKRRARREHEETRSTVESAILSAVGSLDGRLDEVSKRLDSIQNWQAGHAADHAVYGMRNRRLERRDDSG